MIAIINYGVGNLFSLCSSLKHLGIDSVVTAHPKELDNAHSIILPGVGAFGDAIKKLRQDGLDQMVLAQVKKGKPLLGICLGMQLLYQSSTEYGNHTGLGLVSGEIHSLRDRVSGECKVPQMGWNSLVFDQQSPILRGVREGEHVYYVHSFYADVTQQTVAHSVYENAKVTGVVQRDNIFGTQFHPEKSGSTGLAILKAFAEIQ